MNVVDFNQNQHRYRQARSQKFVMGERGLIWDYGNGAAGGQWGSGGRSPQPPEARESRLLRFFNKIRQF